jgi:preprotein translocase subunit SecG
MWRRVVMRAKKERDMSAELTEQLILVVHLVLALAIIGLIMLQQGKGADMGASFGAGASQTLLGSSGQR